MVADDEALEQVMFGTDEQPADEDDGALAALPQRAIHISMSTIGVALSRRLAQAHADVRQGYVAAPVFGRPETAAPGDETPVERAHIGKCNPHACKYRKNV